MEQNGGKKGRWSDERVEEVMGNLLRAGVILAGIVVLVGAIFYLIRYGATSPDYRVFRGEPADLRSVLGILVDAIDLRSRGLIQLGLLLLVVTPIARVAFSVFAFARQHDLTYVVLTLIVFALLSYSLAGWHPHDGQASVTRKGGSCGEPRQASSRTAALGHCVLFDGLATLRQDVFALPVLENIPSPSGDSLGEILCVIDL